MKKGLTAALLLFVFIASFSAHALAEDSAVQEVEDSAILETEDSVVPESEDSAVPETVDSVVLDAEENAEAEDEEEAYTVYEAELARLYGSNQIEEEKTASGGKAVGRFENDDCSLVFQIDVPRDGYYDLSFTLKGIGNPKTNPVYIDGTYAGSIACGCIAYSEAVLLKNPLTEGTHEVSVRKDNGWIYLDCLRVIETTGLSPAVYEVSAPLANPNATPETRQLYELLCGCYGRCTLSGQFSDGGIEGEELNAIFSVTGKYPAVLGLDMRDYTPSRMSYGTQSSAVEHAIAFNNLGGIVSFCWHWNAPRHSIYEGRNEEGDPYWWGGYYASNSSFNIRRVMLGEDPEDQELLDLDIRAIAAQLKRLEEQHVPVLWRPLHEAAGEWFWWGAGGADCYKQLWIYLYKQLTEVYACNNLIWVWNGQDPAWYPGDAYVDIISEDIYVPQRQNCTYISKFAEIADYISEPKIIALSENSVPPDMDACGENGVLWSWFCTWKREYVVKGGEYSPAYTDVDTLREIYHHKLVITLDEVAELRRELSQNAPQTDPQDVPS